MDTEIDKVVIKGITYVPESAVVQKAPEEDGLEYKIFRTYSSGVFGGYLASKENSVGHYRCVIKKARRFHYWDGAASLSQLAEEGIKESKKSSCRFAMELSGDLELPNVVEIISVTAKAKANIDGVPVWKV
jgi:hypothetical protein